MIEISLPQALAIYSVVLGMMVAGIWLYTELAVHGPQRSLGRQFLWRCSFCGCTYLDEEAQRLSKCPRCESFNTADEATTRKVQPDLSSEAVETGTGRNRSKRKRHHQKRRGPRRRR